MAKQATQTTDKKVRFYKKAIFPWMIITVLAVFAAGLFTGWTLYAHQSSTIKAEVTSQVASLKEVK